MKLNNSIFKYGKSNNKYLWLSLIIIFLSTLCNLFSFYMGYKIIQGLLAIEIVFSEVFKFAIILIIAKVLQGIFLPTGLKYSHIYAYRTLAEVRRELIQKMAKNPLGETLKFSSGYIRQKLVDSVEQLEILLAHMIPEGVPYFMNFVLTTIFIFIIDWRLGLLLFIPISIALVAMGIMQNNGKNLMGPYYESVKNMSGNMTEYIRGIEVIKIFNRKEHQYEKLKDSIDYYRKFTLNWYDISYTPMAVAFAIGTTFTLAIIPVGTWMLMNGRLELSRFIFVCLLAFSQTSSVFSIMIFSSAYMNLSQRLKDIEQDFLVKELEVGEKRLEDVQEICFKDVHFAYDKDKEIIKGVSLNIKKGDQVAFVGESGSGKTTLIKLLMHYYDVTSGEISINNKNLKDISLESLMEKISYVSQDNFLFDISIRDNLLVGKPDVSEEEIESACKRAFIHDEILKLENGYDTVVGQSGSKLSGGQKQRICIARAMLKNADILILDEATSNTDPENEFKINRAVEELSKDKILISIAHKLSTIANANRIYLLNEGSIADEGTHEELLQNDIYKNLWERFMGANKFEIKLEGE